MRKRVRPCKKWSTILTPTNSVEEVRQAKKQQYETVFSCHHDPYTFVMYTFPWGEKGTELEKKKGPRRWQKRVLKKIGRLLREGKINSFAEVIQIAVSSGHGIGKSALVAWLILWALATKIDTRGVVTANTESQLRTKTWPEVAKWHNMSNIKDWFIYTATSLYSSIPKHEKTWRIDMSPWSVNNTEAFAGLHNEGKRLLLIFDEASAIADKVWEVAEGALTDENTEIIWVAFGNPTRNTGRFRECFRRFRKFWYTLNIDARTVEGTNKAQAARMIEQYGINDDRVKVRVLGQFPSKSVKQYISSTTVDEAFGRHLRPDAYQYAPKIIACDPAWEGDDMLIIGMRQGLHYQILREIPNNDNDVQIANILAQLEDEHMADAVFIDAGYGTGIYSAGTTMGRDHWQLVWFGGKSSTPGFLNKRAEMYGMAKDWLQQGGAIPREQRLYSDLTSIETVARLDGIVQLESKKEMKKRELPSPDYSDNLAVTFAYPVNFLHGQRPRGEQQQAVSDFDPYASEAA